MIFEKFVKASDAMSKKVEVMLTTAEDKLNTLLSNAWTAITHISTERIAKSDGLQKLPEKINEALDGALDVILNKISHTTNN